MSPEQIRKLRHLLKAKKIGLLVLRLLIGALFITTAVFKLLAIEEFELYIYSFGIFNFLLSTIVARLVIMAEMLFGICLMAKLMYKYVWRLTMLMLVGFTLLLIYVAIFRNDTNCHCFGEIVPLAPVKSIIKNVVTMLLMVLIRKEKDYRFRGKVVVIVFAFLVSIIVPFVVFPMDAVINKLFAPDGDIINVEAFTMFQEDSTMTDFDIHDGNYVIAVYSSGCKYCKMSAKITSMMMEQNGIDSTRFQIFIYGDTAQIQEFLEETNTQKYTWHHIIDPYMALALGNGSFPVYYVTADGKVIKGLDYRGMNESALREYLSDYKQ